MGKTVVEVELNLATVSDATASAKAVAQTLYEAAPINNTGGQVFKNEFVKAFLGLSGRARQQAAEFLGVPGASHKLYTGEASGASVFADDDGDDDDDFGGCTSVCCAEDSLEDRVTALENRLNNL